MNSSYCAVPGRGGASAGNPPAHCGTKSPKPAASFSLMLPQPPRPLERSATDQRATSWRGLMIDIGELRNLGTVHLGQPDRPRQPNLKTATTSFSASRVCSIIIPQSV